MTNYDNDEMVPSKTIDFTAFLIADGSSNPSVCVKEETRETLIYQRLPVFYYAQIVLELCMTNYDRFLENLSYCTFRDLSVLL